MAILDQIIDQARTQSLLELVAVMAAILYLLLAIRENILCWFFAALSTAIFIWLYGDIRLYMESALNGYYLLMAGYGWFWWSRGDRRDREQHRQSQPVVSWPFRTHAIAIAALVGLSGVNGALLSYYTDAALPYLDSLTTWLAVWATFLVAKKVLENWWYWLFIDALLIWINWTRGLELTSLLYVGYLCMIPFGLVAWTKSRRNGAH